MKARFKALGFSPLHIIIILLVSGLLGFTFSLYRYRSAHVVFPHMGSAGIQTFHYPTAFVKQLIGDPHAGEKIFTEFCSSCHGRTPFIEVNAPRIGDAEAWAIRRKLSLDMLLHLTEQGVGAMPARGGCFECTDQQLLETIQYILNQTP